MHVDLIGMYIKFIKQQNLGDAIIKNNVSLTCMKMIEPTTGWFEIVEVTTFALDEVMVSNDEYIDK